MLDPKCFDGLTKIRTIFYVCFFALRFLNYDECWKYFVTDKDMQDVVDKYKECVGFFRCSALRSIDSVDKVFEYCVQKVVQKREKKSKRTCIIS